MAAARKGTATPLGAVFSPEETRRAVARVAEAVSARCSELGRLQSFITDNAALISLVQRLPDELSHEIMVPFGGAAFFPGSLVHTNQLLVLLGDGYYADRSAKQTTDILRRRGVELEAQVEAIKATISDLEAEAKFFESTADEASVGLVEIREEYEDDAETNLSESGASSSSEGMLDKDKEHARIMARLAELEMEEREAGSTSEDDDDDDDEEDGVISEDGEENGDALSDDIGLVDASFGASVSGSSSNNQSHENMQLKSALKKLGGREMLKGPSLAPSSSTSYSVFPGQGSVIMNSEVQVPMKKVVSFRDDNNHAVSSPKSPALPQDPRYSASAPEVSSGSAPSRDRKIISSGQQAFTGSIVEHDDNLSAIHPPRSNDSEKPVSSASARPVSRFKMQKGGR